MMPLDNKSEVKTDMCGMPNIWSTWNYSRCPHEAIVEQSPIDNFARKPVDLIQVMYDLIQVNSVQLF